MLDLLFAGFAERIATNYPAILCTIASPWPLYTFFCLNLFYLALFRLMMVTNIDFFINLQHEVVVRRLLLTSCALVPFLVIVEVVRAQGTYCQADMAILLFATRLGLPDRISDTLQTTVLPWAKSLALSALLCYLLSLVIQNKDQLKRLLKIASCKSSRTIIHPERQQETKSRNIHGTTRAQIYGLNNDISLISIESPSPPILRNHGAFTRDDYLYQPTSVQSHASPVPQSEAVVRGRQRPAVLDVTAFQLQLPSISSNDEVPRLVKGVQANPSSTPSPGPSQPSAKLIGAPIGRREPVVLDEPALQSAAAYDPLPNREAKKEKNWKMSFFLGFFISFMTLLIIIVGVRTRLVVEIMSKLYLLCFFCLPAYWVLMIDDCYAVAKRKTKVWLAHCFNIYIDEN